MAKQTERRVNKSFVVPSDQERPLIDPTLTDIEADHRYDAIEELRAGRAAADAQAVQTHDEPPTGQDLDADRAAALREAQVGMANVDLTSAQAEADREALANEWNVGATSTASTLDEEHFEELQAHAADMSADANAAVDTGSQDISPDDSLHYP